MKLADMKLYVTLTSPYARIVRIAILEKGLQSRVEIIPAQTRTPDSPYYAINPSGRVPCLVTDEGAVLEESAVIVEYLDALDGRPTLYPPDPAQHLEVRRWEGCARSMLDGIALWSREYLYRPAEQRSPVLIAHEGARANRMADLFERAVENPVFSGPLNMAQITLACTLHGRNDSPAGFDWRRNRPRLATWVDRIGERPSVAATLARPAPHPAQN